SPKGAGAALWGVRGCSRVAWPVSGHAVHFSRSAGEPSALRRPEEVPHLTTRHAAAPRPSPLLSARRTTPAARRPAARVVPADAGTWTPDAGLFRTLHAPGLSLGVRLD